MFDWAVNSGVGRSARTLQKIIGVTADGGIGPQTLAAVAEHDTEQLITDMHVAGARLSMSASRPLSISARQAGPGAMKRPCTRP